MVARENNFLLGYGERLTAPVTIKSGGGDKNPPYDFDTAKWQVATWLRTANNQFQTLPSEACPNDQVTAIITLHPRYVSKSEFPSDLLNSVGLRAVGGRTKKIKPREWGITKHPEEAITDELLVMGSRKAFSSWSENLNGWVLSNVSKHLTHFEELTAFSSEQKIKALPDTTNDIVLEVVLHDTENPVVIEQFMDFATKLGAQAVVQRAKQTKGLTFIPVYADKNIAKKLAMFSFIRVVRAMPTMRPLHPGPTRSNQYYQVNLPTEVALDPSLRVVIFDGGLPQNNPVTPWVNYIEPASLANPVPELSEHGLNVTSALLFGPLNLQSPASRPLCHIDHVRVLDDRTGTGGDFEYYDVLDRILEVLDDAKKANQPYDFMNISLGPDIPVDDDDVTRWTSDLDTRLAGGNTFATVAAGNAGQRDPLSGLNRVQPPSDAVNVLCIGACDNDRLPVWKRTAYSCVGPGRRPGVVKPDGVVFGGDNNNPFFVLTSRTGGINAAGVAGTSFAAPYALRTAVAVKAQLGNDFGAMALRALLLHRADRGIHSPVEVGWGRLETDYDRLITCDDDEALVIFQGQLPVKEHLRAPVPLPDGNLTGFVTIDATLVISPEVDPSFPNAYTRAGLEIAFRPNSDKFNTYDNGKVSAHAATKSFFNAKNMKISEFELREEGHKWEPCLKASQRFQASTLKDPCFDIYYHNRYEGMPQDDPKPIPYALVISIRAPKVSNLYDRVVRTYMNQLIPLQPKTRIQIRP